jgi:mannitol 2-dehydrogenase
MVEDVEPFELMKLRLLNAGHQAVGYFGHLSGHRFVYEVCSDPVFTDFLGGYMDQEATPTLAPVPGVDLEDYKDQLLQRLASAAVKDTLPRLCATARTGSPRSWSR